MRSLLLVLCFLLSSCCPKSGTFVLLPDPDGKVGEIEISNNKGTQTLDQPRQAVRVASKGSGPGAAAVMEEEEIRQLFGAAMDIQPFQPISFRLQFEFDSTVVRPEFQELLGKIVETIAERKSMDISVNAHTDRAGNSDYNYQLSLKRAKNIEKFLVEKGIDPAIISTSSHGEGNPLVPTADNVQEPRNRRVEVIIR